MREQQMSRGIAAACLLSEAFSKLVGIADLERSANLESGPTQCISQKLYTMTYQVSFHRHSSVGNILNLSHGETLSNLGLM